MIENDTTSQGAIDGYKSALEEANTETVQPRGLRASNTHITLTPVEVCAVSTTGGYPYIGSFEKNDAGDLVEAKDPVRDVLADAGYVLVPPTKSVEPDAQLVGGYVESDFMYPNLPSPESESDAPVGAETDPPEEDRTWVLALILDRLEDIEDKFEALIARIEKHDIRASHRILRD